MHDFFHGIGCNFSRLGDFSMIRVGPNAGNTQDSILTGLMSKAFDGDERWLSGRVEIALLPLRVNRSKCSCDIYIYICIYVYYIHRQLCLVTLGVADRRAVNYKK